MPKPLKLHKQQVRGAKRMRERGHKLVQLWLDPREYALIAAVANRDRKKLATWIREQAFHAAQRSEQERIRAERRDSADHSS